MKKYIFPILIIIIAALVLLDPFAETSPNDHSNHDHGATSLPEPTSTGKALIGGDFSLIDTDGNTRTDKDFRGKYMLVYLGFTNCPHVCPTALLRITNAMEALPKEMAEQVEIVFITIDPERDTAERMKEYFIDYYPGIIGLTGSKEALAEAKAAYKAYAAKEEADEDGNYNVGHSSFIYVMSPEGEYLKHYPHNVKDAELAAYLIKTIGE